MHNQRREKRRETETLKGKKKRVSEGGKEKSRYNRRIPGELLLLFQKVQNGGNGKEMRKKTIRYKRESKVDFLDDSREKRPEDRDEKEKSETR